MKKINVFILFFWFLLTPFVSFGENIFMPENVNIYSVKNLKVDLAKDIETSSGENYIWCNSCNKYQLKETSDDLVIKFVVALSKNDTKMAAKLRNSNFNRYFLFPDTVYFEWGDSYFYAIPFHNGILWLEELYLEWPVYKFYYITYSKGKIYRFRMDKSLFATQPDQNYLAQIKSGSKIDLIFKEYDDKKFSHLKYNTGNGVIDFWKKVDVMTYWETKLTYFDMNLISKDYLLWKIKNKQMDLRLNAFKKKVLKLSF
jgi:hypothetical protein